MMCARNCKRFGFTYTSVVRVLYAIIWALRDICTVPIAFKMEKWAKWIYAVLMHVANSNENAHTQDERLKAQLLQAAHGVTHIENEVLVWISFSHLEWKERTISILALNWNLLHRIQLLPIRVILSRLKINRLLALTRHIVLWVKCTAQITSLFRWWWLGTDPI